MKGRSIATPHIPTNKKDEWITPPEIIKDFGEFDLDPCAAIKQPWKTAKKMIDKRENGLVAKWNGTIWMNPPYGSEIEKWMKRLADHGNGMALVFARTDTKWFHEQVFSKAHAILFFKRRITFFHVDGNKASANSGAPSCLIGYGETMKKRLNVVSNFNSYKGSESYGVVINLK